MPRGRLRRLKAASTHGVVTATTVDEAGMPSSTFHDWRDREALDRPHHDVTLLPGHEPTPEQRIQAAVSGIGPECAITGWTAAYLYGLRSSPPTTVEVLVPHGSSHRPHEKVLVVETVTFANEEIRTLAGIPVVSPARMLLDLARAAEFDVLVAMAIDLRGHRLLRLGDLDRHLSRRSRFPGRPLAVRLANAIRADGTDSGFELRTRRRLEARGTPADPGQLEVIVAGRRRRIDIPFGDEGVGIECLGLAYHGDQRAFERDSDRRNDFAEDGGWRILELTHQAFLTRWDEFTARLDRFLEA